MQASTSDAKLTELLGILKGVKFDEGLDYETIGKMVVASILSENAEKVRTQKPDSKGHVLLKSNVRYSAGLTQKQFAITVGVTERTGRYGN